MLVNANGIVNSFKFIVHYLMLTDTVFYKKKRKLINKTFVQITCTKISECCVSIFLSLFMLTNRAVKQ